MRASLPHLRHIVHYAAGEEVAEEGVMSWRQLMELGRAQVSCDWRRAGQQVTMLTSDWSRPTRRSTPG